VSNYEIKTFLWNNEPGHDKVWGYFAVGDGTSARLYNFWGARGRKLSFKEFPQEWDSMHELKTLARKKQGKGYREIPINDIETVVDGFLDEFELQFVKTKLFNNFRGRRASA
jgi:predicted DNA-binding WGR domain protein